MKKEEKTICKITVLKRTIHQDLYEKYRNKKGNLCEVFTDYLLPISPRIR